MTCDAQKLRGKEQRVESPAEMKSIKPSQDEDVRKKERKREINK